MSDLQEFNIPTDTLIHIGGLPFELKAGTSFYGLESNMRLAQDQTDGQEYGSGESSQPLSVEAGIDAAIYSLRKEGFRVHRAAVVGAIEAFMAVVDSK